ncbi:hypothetical protein JMN32_23910 [Fulvivirga sp. 29W222]|uniref:Uncharacterized protein n=1 Tax=Fulvivirga marina TaxID=2494733 RepID=A0A937G3J2_9BACT|nr:hypothetical protein [Fulvivirga marina]MBL6449378.1 hypothetical protein [Fulvivirga marina]
MTNTTSNSAVEESQLAPVCNEPNQPGYFVYVDEKYYFIDPYHIQWEFGFHKLQNLKYAPVEGQDFKVIVNLPNWAPNHAAFFAQPIEIVNHDYTTPIEPKVTVNNFNRIELTFDKLKQGQLLIIRDQTNLYGIGIGSISGKLVDLFNTTDRPSHAVLGNLKDALKSFPNNVQLKELLGVWEEKYVVEKSEKTWATVLEKWETYKREEERGSKKVFANDVEHEIEYYLSLADNQPNKGEAESILEKIEVFRNTKVDLGPKRLPGREELSGRVTCYRGYGSMDLFITMVEVGSKGDVLLRFRGLPNEADGVVYLHKKAIQNESTGSYILQSSEINGDNWNTLSYENDGWGGGRLFVYPPLVNQAIDIAVDHRAEGVESPDEMYDDYCNRVK